MNCWDSVTFGGIVIIYGGEGETRCLPQIGFGIGSTIRGLAEQLLVIYHVPIESVELDCYQDVVDF